MSDLQVVLLIVGGLLAAAMVQRLNAPSPAFCASCGTLGRPVRKSTASVGMALAMWGGGLAGAWFVHWVFLLVPLGHLVAVASGSSDTACARCGGTQLLPPDSPMARKLRRELDEGR